MEDKTFPKTNSLLDGVKQPLADPEEFALKIKACKESQRDPDFCVVARVEAFIAGYGLEEALKRADMYHKAGADAILMHSKRSDPSEIEAFVNKWSNQSPVVIVPTKYYKTPTEQFRKWGISTVIWANHNLRSCISAMQNVCKTIKEEESLVNIESKVATVKEVFRLQDEDQLLKDEEKFLP